MKKYETPVINVTKYNSSETILAVSGLDKTLTQSNPGRFKIDLNS